MNIYVQGSSAQPVACSLLPLRVVQCCGTDGLAGETSTRGQPQPLSLFYDLAGHFSNSARYKCGRRKAPFPEASRTSEKSYTSSEPRELSELVKRACSGTARDKVWR